MGHCRYHRCPLSFLLIIDIYIYNKDIYSQVCQESWLIHPTGWGMNAGTPSPATDNIIITQIVIYTIKCIRVLFVVYQTSGAVLAFSHPPIHTSNHKTILLISTKWFKNVHKPFLQIFWILDISHICRTTLINYLKYIGVCYL